MEQLRMALSDNKILNFKKSLFGYDMKEIMEYITTQEQNMKNSIFNYEKKLSEQTDSLTMVLREKENLVIKVAELEESVRLLSLDIDEQKSCIVAENNALKARINELLDYERRNEMLHTEMIDLQSRCDYCEAERTGLLNSIKDKEDTILQQCKNNAQAELLLKTEMEMMKSQFESTRKVQLLNLQAAKDGLNKVMNIVTQI